jgi:peptidoglycan/xylan/chitin deacetylase (PgdA/CDA1 family)
MGRVVRGVLAILAGLALIPVASVRFASPAGAVINRCGPATYGIHRYAPGKGKTVALTFDDGPGALTAQVLRILSDARVEATFFNIGGEEASHPVLVRREYARGFALGDHTWSHAELTLLDRAGQAYQIDRARAKQAAITGAYPCLLRPPYGDSNATTLDLAQRRGMTVWNWSVDTEDWKATGSDDPYWVDRIVSRARAGAALQHPVILMHNPAAANPATVAALPRIIRYYKLHGYRFVDLYGHTGHPVVGRIAPASGPAAGGTRVTLTGRNLVGVRAVRFGARYGTAIDVESCTRLSVLSPPHGAGVVDVRVVTTFGTSPLVAADRYTYANPP